MGLSKEIRAGLTKQQIRHYKQTGEFLQASHDNVSITSDHDPNFVTVLCVRFGNRYGIEYVERLRNMVSRHLTIPHNFVCLTDSNHVIQGVQNITIPNHRYNKQWWHKVHMFDPNLGLRDRILYIDLDVVIINNIDMLISDKADTFYGIKDFNRKFIAGWKILNSSVMSWIAGQHSEIYTKFKSNPAEAMRLQGDQDWIYKVAKDKIKYWPEEWIQSYKWEVRNKSEITFKNGKRNFRDIKTIVPQKNCGILVFHGDPKPEEVLDPIIVDNWR
jgi:hypothetical protein